MVNYKLEDKDGEEVEGSWLSDQMNKVDGSDKSIPRVVERVVDRKPGKVKIKYLGWPDKYNQWVSNTTLKPIIEDEDG